MLKNFIILIEEKKYKITKTVKNSYSATKNYRKLKRCWHPKTSLKLSNTIRQTKKVS